MSYYGRQDANDNYDPRDRDRDRDRHGGGGDRYGERGGRDRDYRRSEYGGTPSRSERSQSRGPSGGGQQRESGGQREIELQRRKWEEQGLSVQANLFRLRFQVGGLQTWYQYQIQINSIVRKPKIDAEGNTIKDDLGKPVFEDVIKGSIFDERDLSGDTEAAKSRQDKRNRSSHISRRVILALQREQKIEFVSDGTQMAFCSQRLPGFEMIKDERPTFRLKEKAAAAGIYGPADKGGSAVAPQQDPIIKPWRVYPPVQVRVNCEEDDPEAHLSPIRRFQVKLTEVGAISFNVDYTSGNIRVEDDASAASCCQAVNLAVQNAMLGQMLALERSPKLYFFRNNIPEGPDIKFNFNPQCMPLYGLLQTVKLTGSGICLLADLGLGWQRLETDKNQVPLRVLEPDERGPGGKLAGVRLDDINKPVPEAKRDEVHKALQQLTFHVKYKCPDRWIDEMKSKPLRGFDDRDMESKKKELQKRARKGIKNQRMTKLKDEKNIAWGSNDEREHSFEFAYIVKGQKEEPRQTTVAEYYERRYYIQLKYPCMPMVRISKNEWFPVEFLFVAHGPAARGINERERTEYAERKTRFALAFNDKFACTERIKEISSLLNRDDVLPHLTEKLQLFNLNMDPSPMKLKSKVLKVPRLLDGTGNEIGVQNGSWNLRNSTQFRKGSIMHSFAVLNLAGHEASKYPDLPSEIFGALARHGVELPFLGRHLENPAARKGSGADVLWNRVIFNPPAPATNPQLVRLAFEQARQKAKRVFFKEMLSQNLCVRALAHVTGVKVEEMKVEDVVVVPDWLVVKMPNQGMEQDQYGVLNYHHFRTFPTHMVTIPGGRELEAYLVYELDIGMEMKPPLDFDHIRFLGDRLEVFNPDKGWKPIQPDQIRPVFRVVDRNSYQIFSPDALESYFMLDSYIKNIDGQEQVVRSGHLINEDGIECPSIVYVVLPGKQKDLYYWSKGAAYLGPQGVITQTVVLESYGRQKNHNQKMQFCSNIALKTNTKLARNKACAWSWADQFFDGREDRERLWLGEVPTLIVSLAMASSQGQENKMVVVGTGYLDIEGQTCSFEVRAQPKSHIIDGDVIKGIFKGLIWSYVQYNNGQPPDRMVIIRSGGHEGHFFDIVETEISAVRKGYVEAKPDGSDCGVCRGEGCRNCCPLITLLVAQSAHHNIRLVPNDSSVGIIKNNKNVPSGTCVSSSELLLPINAGRIANEEQLRRDPGALELFPADTNGASDDFFLVSHGGLKGTSNGVLYRVVLNENKIFRKFNTTPLTGEMLQRLVYSLSFIYGKATKAPRDTALVRQGAILAQNVLGIISSMNRQEESEFLQVRVTDSGSEIFTTASGDGLIPSFSPLRENLLIESLRPHVLA